MLWAASCAAMNSVQPLECLPGFSSSAASNSSEPTALRNSVTVAPQSLKDKLESKHGHLMRAKNELENVRAEHAQQLEKYQQAQYSLESQIEHWKGEHQKLKLKYEPNPDIPSDTINPGQTSMVRTLCTIGAMLAGSEHTRWQSTASMPQ